MSVVSPRWIKWRLTFLLSQCENNVTNCAQIGQDSKVFHLRARDFNAISIKIINGLNC